MKNLLTILFLSVCSVCSVGLFTSCSTPVTVSAEARFSPEAAAQLERTAVMASATLALRNNPGYIPVVRALADGVDAALSADREITRAGLATWVREICAARHVKPEDVPLFVVLADSVYTAFTAAYGDAIILHAADPRVRPYAQAFRDGLRSALAALNTD